jgi:hypothetical protein
MIAQRKNLEAIGSATSLNASKRNVSWWGLQQNGWWCFNKYYPSRVYVVIFYRMYYEMLSMWNEGNKPYNNLAHNPYKEEFKKWPSEGGKHPILLNCMAHRLNPHQSTITQPPLYNRSWVHMKCKKVVQLKHSFELFCHLWTYIC